MTRLAWDQVGERRYETGVDHGVLFVTDDAGVYGPGVAWNGLTTVTESPSGAEASPQYADNIKYLNLVSAEEFAATIEALTYPDEFELCDGSAEIAPGVVIGQQNRKVFGFSYRTKVGTDTNPDAGYKIHLVYGCLAAPSEKARTTVNDSPEASAMSWEVSTTTVAVGEVSGVEYKPTAHLTIDSTKTPAAQMQALEDLLYGDEGTDAELPMPSAVAALLGGGAPTEVRLTGANAPTYDAGTHVVTLPAVGGVQWQADGEDVAAGAQPALAVGESVLITAVPQDGFDITGDDDWVFDY